jgi:glucose/arabinose dehydrogenase
MQMNTVLAWQGVRWARPARVWVQTTVWAAGLALLAACGGGDNAAPPTAALQASISSPATGATFRAGQTVSYAGTGTDAEGAALAPAQLSWWAEFHHDSHVHPFLAETPGAGGSVAIPVRGETADNVFYRFHLRATDSRGATVEVTRDLLPQKSQVTLRSVPAGLALTLDGQPVAEPLTFTGVVGIERDLGAADQNAQGRRYRFASWNDGGAASHTISTPAANTTYTATFTDIGPANNQAPTVSISAAASGTVGVAMVLAASAADADGSVAKVEFFDAATKLGEDLSSPYTLSWTPSSTGAHNLTARATDDQGATTTSAAVVVNVSAAPGPDTTPPTLSLTAPANFAAGLTGLLTVSASAADNVGVASVEFQLDGESLAAADTSAPYGLSVDTTLYPVGQHLLRARARDAAGNLSAWAVATVQFGGSRTQPSGFTRNESWVTGLSNATAFVQADDGRWFIAEQGGALRVVKNGVLLTTSFVQLSVDSQGERGLIGVTLDPAFASNGHVYVYQTVTAGGVHNRVSRFTANGDVAAANSEVVLVDLPGLSGATNHNGGAMHFGVDGKLYVAVGDNATSTRSQDLADPFGKMLRFNADASIPSDNPYYNSQTGLARAVWAYGLRNPFTFAVQAGTGRMHINDVGQGTWEEVNLGAPQANYGWPASEGPDNVASGVTGPLFTYKHSAASPAGSGPGGFFTGFAIAGGDFYPASGAFPAGYRDQYYFADYVSRFVGRLDLAPGNDNAAYAFASLSGNPVDLRIGVDGAVYVLTRSAVVRISAP